MRNGTLGSGRHQGRCSTPALVLTIAFGVVSLATACHTASNPPINDVVITAPAAGVVRRVLVSEGAAVDKDSAIIEIAVESEQPIASQPSNPKAEQTRALRAAQTDLASAEGEANRTAGELRRIEPLVKRGLASQSELDKARAQSQDAQERLGVARNRAKAAEEILNQPPATTTSNEAVIAVRVPAAGTVRTVSVQAGQAVKLGQPLATLGAKT